MAARRYQHGQLIDGGDRWEARWREDVVQPSGAVKRVHKWDVLAMKRYCPTKRMAQRLLDEKLAAVNRADYKPVSAETFAVFASKWKTTVMVHHEASTQELETRQIDKTLLPAFGEFPMKDISAEMVQAWVSGLTVGPKTTRNYLATFKLMWKSARCWKHVDHDPFDGLTLPKRKKPKAYTFTPAEMTAIINEASGREVRALRFPAR